MNCREIENLGSEIILLQELLKQEQLATAELLILENLNVMPSVELLSIRREAQLVKDSLEQERDEDVQLTVLSHDNTSGTGSLDHDLVIAEKKVILLKTRRLDEERLLGQSFSAAAAVASMELDNLPNYNHGGEPVTLRRPHPNYINGLRNSMRGKEYN